MSNSLASCQRVFASCVAIIGLLCQAKAVQSTDENSDYASAQCIQNCQLSMMSKVQRDVQDDRILEEIAGGSLSINSSVFEIVCREYRSGRDCMADCLDSGIKRSVQSAYGPLDILCINRFNDFQHHMHCFEKVTKVVDQRCIPVCGDSRGLQQSGRLQTQNLDSMDSEAQKRRAQNLMANLCQFMDCQINCQSPIVYEKCGDEAERLLTTFFASSAKTMEDALKKADDGLEYFPEICKKIARQSASLHNPSFILGIFLFFLIFTISV